MIVFQETYNAHGVFERRLFLNGKTYVDQAKWSERRKCYVERDRYDLPGQLCDDYRQYKDDMDFYGMGLLYSHIINEVIFLYGGTTVDWNIVNIHEWEQEMIADGAKPAEPAVHIPELEDPIYKVTWHHDGSCDTELFCKGEHYTQHIPYLSKNAYLDSVFHQFIREDEDNGWMCNFLSCHHRSDWDEMMQAIIDVNGPYYAEEKPERGPKTKSWTFGYKYIVSKNIGDISGTIKIRVTKDEYTLLQDASKHYEDINDIIELEDVVCDIVAAVEDKDRRIMEKHGLWDAFYETHKKEIKDAKKHPPYKAKLFGCFYMEININA